MACGRGSQRHLSVIDAVDFEGAAVHVGGLVAQDVGGALDFLDGGLDGEAIARGAGIGKDLAITEAGDRANLAVGVFRAE